MGTHGLFSSSVEWKALAHFFEFPSRECYVKELSRELEIGSGSASVSCKRLAYAGLLCRTKRGNSLFYSLNNSSAFVKRLKSAWFLGKLAKLRSAWENPDFVSVALYGSFASGDFVEKSDVDFLVMTSVSRSLAHESFAGVESKLGRETSVLSMPLSEWVSRVRKRERVCVEIAHNHVLLWGSPLVV